MTDYTGFSGFLNEKLLIRNIFDHPPLFLHCASINFSIASRSFFVRSSIDLRLIFDRQSKDERRKNEGRTKDERRMNENRTKNEREPNEERTRSYREPNEKLSLRFEVHFIHYMQHGIARHSVVPCLGASLRVDYLANV